MATVNYSWTLPTVGASVNTWGTLLNTIIDDIDAKMVSKTGAQTLTNKTLTAPVINGFTGDTSAINIGSGQLVKDTSGNLGLGVTPKTSTGSYKAFEIGAAGNLSSVSSGIGTSLSSNTYVASGAIQIYAVNGAAATYELGAGTHAWYTAPSGTAGNPISFTQAMTLDTSGNLTVGGAGANGYKLEVAGNSQAKNTIGQTYQGVGASAMWIDSAGAWSLGLDSANGATARLKVDASGNLTPGANGTQAFGSTSLRWSQVWCTAGAFNTSDARLKTTPVSFTSKEVAAAKALSKEIALYQWLESVEAKGADKARQHVGLTVQRAEQVLKDHGLDPWRYGFMSYDKWDDVTVDHPATEAIEAVDAVLDDEGNVVTPAVEAVPAKPAWTEVTLKAGDAYAFRYDQLNLFISRGLNAEIEAMQTQLDEQNTAMQLLAARLAALEAA